MQKIVYYLFMSLFFYGCMADLRVNTIKKQGIIRADIEKGIKILNETWRAQGFDKLKDHTTYSYNIVDSWKGLMGKIGKPWKESKSEMQFKFALNTFDCQVKFLSGKRKGVIAGLQSWNYYEKEVGRLLEFQKPNKKNILYITCLSVFY